MTEQEKAHTAGWEFQERGRGGILVKHDALGERAIAYIEPAAHGHVIDTGHLIATLLNQRDAAPATAQTARMMMQVLELIEVDLEAGKMPAKVRVTLALSRTKAALASARAAGIKT